MEISNTKAMELAKEFISKKTRKVYYEFKVLWEFNHGMELYVLNHLEEEQIAALKALKAKYGDNEYVKYLEEVFTDEDELRDMKYGHEQVVSIDLNTKYYQYEFMVHEFYADGRVRSNNVLVNLTDDEYAELLVWRLQDQRFTMNTLTYANKYLYEMIRSKVDAAFCDSEGLYMTWYDAPYLATMDEVNRDVEEMLKENPQYRSDARHRCYHSLCLYQTMPIHIDE